MTLFKEMPFNDSAGDDRPVSPNGGSAVERESLAQRFGDRLSVNENLSRKIVSYQGNKDAPGLRWMKYKEGFSTHLVSNLISEKKPRAVLDPFAGIGTTALEAAGHGSDAMGIEIMPVGVIAGTAIAEAANGLRVNAFEKEADNFLEFVRSNKSASRYSFPHVRITGGAFPAKTEKEISRARKFLASVKNEVHKTLLNLACLSVLEDVSYTRKDGQYLRWDVRADRKLKSGIHKGAIPSFADALEKQISRILQDVCHLKEKYGKGRPTLVAGSCLEILRTIPSSSFDMVITSPPYANRYDYTRTYALELAWLGYDQEGFSKLRQQMLSATVENKAKVAWLENVYGDKRDTLDKALKMYAEQGAIHEVLHILRERAGELANRNVIRLIEHYFFEMSLVIAELGRIVSKGGYVYMVNDNVQYHGEEVPVDYILSDFAERSGFQCKKIWKLARGKGNSSQQMAKYGRREIRKCVYEWRRANG